MEQLSEAYWHQDWKGFSKIFAKLYLNGNQSEQLELLRSLLSTYRDTRAQAAVVTKLGLTGLYCSGV